ncbi:MAG: hypothetical protein FWG16_03200 [Micrococcales bacterium]|nr:hypothetical protein [Micrococcales bacterium]
MSNKGLLSPVFRQAVVVACLGFVTLIGGLGCGVEAEPPAATMASDDQCAMVDEPYYHTSRDLENAADVIVRGTITSIELDQSAAGGPSWVVGFDGQQSSGSAADKAMGENTIDLPKVCGEAPYGETFAIGGSFIMLLSGPRDGVFYPVNTTQGVIEIIDGSAAPLARASLGTDEAVTISFTTAETMGAPLRPLVGGDGFVAGELTEGWDQMVVPQFQMADVGAAWSPKQDTLWVLTAGSSTCPPYVSATATGDGQEVLIQMSTQPLQQVKTDQTYACTADLIRYTTEVTVPPSVDADLPLTIHFDPLGAGDGEPATIVVQPRPEPGVVGPATWAPPWVTNWSNDATTLVVQAGGWAPGVPEFVESLDDGQVPEPRTVGAGWSWQTNLLYVFTWGSSSCPVVASSATGDAGQVAVTLDATPFSGPCTRDWVPTTSIVETPSGVDNGQPVTVQLGDLGAVVVQPRSQEGDPFWGWTVSPPAWLP